MNQCQPFADAVLDPAAPQPAGLQAHLSGCESCAALDRGHRAAQQLRHQAVYRSERTPVRTVVVRTLALGTAVVAVVATALAIRPPTPSALPAAPLHAALPAGDPVQVEQPVLRAQPSSADDAEVGLALVELSRTVGGYARVNPAVLGYGPRWKSLPALLAPRRSQPLAALEKNFHPFVYTSEE